jgi:hypothetical protein
MGIEIVSFVSILVANMIFLFFRSIYPQNLTVAVEELLLMTNSDYLESQQIMLTLFVSSFTIACTVKVTELTIRA